MWKSDCRLIDVLVDDIPTFWSTFILFIPSHLEYTRDLPSQYKDIATYSAAKIWYNIS